MGIFTIFDTHSWNLVMDLFPDSLQIVDRFHAYQQLAQAPSTLFPEFTHYFHVHQRRMQYQEIREDSYPIGSGTVESRFSSSSPA